MFFFPTKRFTVAGLFLIFGLAHVSAADPVNKTLFGGVAIKGYDTVAYHTKSEPVKGDKKFQHEWMGAKWRFSSQENLDLFKANPEKYAPAYGGYCAWAVSQNYTADIDPDAWAIVDGKLYLNYDKDIKKKWEADRDQLIEAADKNWPKLKE